MLIKRKYSKVTLFIIVVFLLGFTQQAFSISIKVRSYDHTDFTRLVFESSSEITFRFEKQEQKIVLTIDQYITTFNTSGVQQYSVLIGKITQGTKDDKTIIDISIKNRYKLRDHFIFERPYRIVFDIEKAKTLDPNLFSTSDISYKKTEETQPDPKINQNQDPPPQENSFRTNQQNVLENIKSICIDPGHGGNDIGAEGKLGILEKDLTLEISKKLKNRIIARLGIDVKLTRENDTEVSLNHRAAIANNMNANLFVSIHINGSYRGSVRGPEIYFASLKATDTKAFNLAQKENKSFTETDEENGSKLNMILWNMSQTQHIKESSILAEAVQEELNVLMNTVNRGVKQAPFRVLMRANMPAILIEVAFITNSVEEEKLSRNSFLERISSTIFRGIEKYINYYNTRYK